MECIRSIRAGGTGPVPEEGEHAASRFPFADPVGTGTMAAGLAIGGMSEMTSKGALTSSGGGKSMAISSGSIA